MLIDFQLFFSDNYFWKFLIIVNWLYYKNFQNLFFKINFNQFVSLMNIYVIEKLRTALHFFFIKSNFIVSFGTIDKYRNFFAKVYQT